MAIQRRAVTYRGVEGCPIMFHNDRLADPRDHYAQELSRLNEAKKRKGADKLKILDEMAFVEWQGGMYFDDKLGPYVKSETVKASAIGAAKLFRHGTLLAQTLHVAEPRIKLKFKGPDGWDDLVKVWEDYSDRRSVNVSGKRIIRTRPCFSDWQIDFTFVFDDEALKDDYVEKYATLAGVAGISEGRKIGFGKFDIVRYEALEGGGQQLYKKAA